MVAVVEYRRRKRRQYQHIYDVKTIASDITGVTLFSPQINSLDYPGIKRTFTFLPRYYYVQRNDSRLTLSLIIFLCPRDLNWTFRSITNRRIGQHLKFIFRRCLQPGYGFVES